MRYENFKENVVDFQKKKKTNNVWVSMQALTLMDGKLFRRELNGQICSTHPPQCYYVYKLHCITSCMVQWSDVLVFTQVVQI